MKIHRLSKFVLLFALVSLLLTACGGSLYHSWPGVSVNQDVVYLSYQGSVYAVNADTGTEVWRFPQKADPSKPFFAAPAIGDNLIVVGNFGHQVYALDMNGQPKWSGPFEVETGNFIATPLITADTILAPSSNGRLYALDLNGSLRWSFETRNMLWATPASDGETVYLAALDHRLYALNLADGRKLWETDLGSALQSAPLLSEDGQMFVSTLGGQVVSIDPATGSVIWRTEAGGRLWSTPLLSDGTLYVGSDNGHISAISADDGTLAWQKTVSGSIIGGGVLVDDGVAFPTEEGNVVAWRLDGSQQMWNPSVNGKLYSTPAVSGQTLVVALTESDQLLQAYTLDGRATWQFNLPK